MGQENSHEQVDDSVLPQTLKSRSLGSVANFMIDGEPKRIVVLTGAGISTSAGIPDFRSPETGLYANLARLDLPYAEAVFDISYFRRNPDPFYVLAKELYPGQFSPTIAHAFIALLEKKGMLQMLFTQNIDCLERRAGVSAPKIVEAHGSFATQRCIECKTEFPDDLMREAVYRGDVPHCLVPQCNGLVKPDIVFFGESLPENFHKNTDVLAMADLLIIMGTSLTVYPFAKLPGLVREGVPRLLFNLERVGDLGSRPDDVCVLGDCDDGVRKLADALGWSDELDVLWRDVAGKKKEEELLARLEDERKKMSKDELLEAEIRKLTAEVDQTLKLSNDHAARVNGQLEKNPTKPDASPILATASHESIKDDSILQESAASRLAVSILSNGEHDDADYPPWGRFGIKDKQSSETLNSASQNPETPESSSFEASNSTGEATPEDPPVIPANEQQSGLEASHSTPPSQKEEDSSLSERASSVTKLASHI